MLEPDSLIPVGKITGTHGVRGLLKFHSFSGSPENIRSAGHVMLRFRNGALREYDVAAVVDHSGRFLLSLEGFDDINQVADLVGSELCLRRNQLPETEEDEYYWCDLIGLRVVTADGEQLGEIADIFDTGSSDVYVVRGAGREYLIPAIADVVRTVDLAGGKVVITPLDGMLDL